MKTCDGYLDGGEAYTEEELALINTPHEGDNVLYSGLEYKVLSTWHYTPSGELILSLQSKEGFSYEIVPITRFFELDGEVING